MHQSMRSFDQFSLYINLTLYYPEQTTKVNNMNKNTIQDEDYELH